MESFFFFLSIWIMPSSSWVSIDVAFLVLPHIVTYAGLQFESFCLSLLKI